MYRIRLHGRGGLGLKTAGRVLGSALFEVGYDVQDAPLYGAERRGAPMLAYVRANRCPINERGVIRNADLVVVSDPSLFDVAGAGVLAGLDRDSVLLINGHEPSEAWRARLQPPCRVVVLDLPADLPRELVGTACAAGAARLLGVVKRAALERALRAELASLGSDVVAANLGAAWPAFDALAPFEGCVREGADLPTIVAGADWVDVAAELGSHAAATIHTAATSTLSNTGAWRSERPVVSEALCHRCHWICSTMCPDGAITVRADGVPIVDVQHCKGCMICAFECPWHAIRVEPERPASAPAGGEAP